MIVSARGDRFLFERTALIICILIFHCVHGAAADLPADLDFIPDPGVRIDNASNVSPSVDSSGVVYLF